VIAAILLGAAFVMGPQQDDPTALAAADGWQAVIRKSDSHVEGDEIVYLLEGFRLTGPPARRSDGDALQTVSAEHVELRLDRARYELLFHAVPQDPAVPAPPAAPAATTPKGLVGRMANRVLVALGLPADEALLLRLEMEGEVHIGDSESDLLCRRLVHDGRAGTTLIDEADLRARGNRGPNGWPLRILAERLRESADGTLEATGARLTTCDHPQPHYAVQLATMRGVPLDEGAWSWTTEGAWLEVYGSRVLPLPAPDFGPEGNFLGFQGVGIFSDSARGQGAELRFGGTHSLGDLDARLSWRVAPGASSRRGFPLGAEVQLESDFWAADWDLFWLDDQGSDKTRLAQQVIATDPQRYRLRLDNRFELSPTWRLDADLALTSDALVDPEFFGDDWRREEDARSELYLRHAGAGHFVDALVTYRLDDSGYTPFAGFPAPGRDNPQSVDLAPQVRYESYATTITELPAGFLGGADGQAPLDFSWGAEVARMRKRDRALTTAPGVRPFDPNPALGRDRVRAWGEAAVPLHAAGAFFRPGVRANGLAYDDNVNRTEGAQRGTVEAFAEAGVVLVRDYSHGWRHLVLPQARFRSAQASGEDRAFLPKFDRFDRQRPGDVLELSLRQFWYAPATSAPWLDVDVLWPWYPDTQERLRDGSFPQPRRSDPATHQGPAELRTVWTPGVYGDPLAGLRVETRVRQDFLDSEYEEIFARMSVSPHERLDYGVAWRKVEDRFSLVELSADWRFSDSWAVRVQQPFSLGGRPSKQSRLELRRYGHDFVFLVGYDRSQADGQSGFHFSLEPRFLSDRPPGHRGLGLE